MKKLGLIILSMSLRESPNANDLEAGITPKVSAFYSDGFKELLFLMAGIDKKTPVPSTQEVLESKYVERFFLEEK